MSELTNTKMVVYACIPWCPYQVQVVSVMKQTGVIRSIVKIFVYYIVQQNKNTLSTNFNVY